MEVRQIATEFRSVALSPTEHPNSFRADLLRRLDAAVAAADRARRCDLVTDEDADQAFRAHEAVLEEILALDGYELEVAALKGRAVASWIFTSLLPQDVEADLDGRLLIEGIRLLASEHWPERIDEVFGSRDELAKLTALLVQVIAERDAAGSDPATSGATLTIKNERYRDVVSQIMHLDSDEAGVDQLKREAIRSWSFFQSADDELEEAVVKVAVEMAIRA